MYRSGKKIRLVSGGAFVPFPPPLVRAGEVLGAVLARPNRPSPRSLRSKRAMRDPHFAMPERQAPQLLGPYE